MKKMIYVLTIFALMIALRSSGQSTAALPSNALKDLEKAEQAMFKATYDGDSAAFRKICGTDYYTINADGNSANLEQSLPFVPRFKGATTVLSEQSQRIFGNLAIRNGRAKFYFGGRQVAEVLYTTGWIYRDSRWQYIHWQGTMTGMMLDPIRGKVNLGPPPTADELKAQQKKADSKVN